MSDENNEQKSGAGIEFGAHVIEFSDIVLFVKGMFVCAIWFAFVLMLWGLIASTIGTPYRENVPSVDAINFNTGITILATFIIVFQFSRLNNTLKEIKKAIEDKQPVIIQKKISMPEQERKQNGIKV